MNSKEEGRRYFLGEDSPAFTLVCNGRPSWMTDYQWQQAQDYVSRKAVPTDAEVIEAMAGGHSPGSRARTWAYSNVSAFVIGKPSFQWWCELIREYSTDPALEIDEGL